MTIRPCCHKHGAHPVSADSLYKIDHSNWRNDVTSNRHQLNCNLIETRWFKIPLAHIYDDDRS